MHSYSSHFDYLPLAVQHYVGGRILALQMHMPVAGNILHHAVELFLKAQIAEYTPTKELANSKKYGHHLDLLWHEYTRRVPACPEYHFETISELDRFEEIRYPRAEREQLATSYALYKGSDGSRQTAEGAYSFTLECIDELVSFLASNPKLKSHARELAMAMPSFSIQALLDSNRHKHAWVDT